MSTETSSTLLLPPHQGITPVDPDFDDNARAEQERERKADCPELLQFLKRTCESIKNQRQEEWERILNSQVRCVAYYDDRQYGTVREGVFQDARVEPGDIRPIDNQYKIQIDKLLMEFARSQTTIKVAAANPTDTRMVEAAKFAQSRINAGRKRTLKASERLREAQALLLKTMTYRYMFFNTDAAYSPKERKPRTATKSYGRTRSLVACKICGSPMKPTPASSGEAQDEYRCINCGSNRQKKLELGPQQQEVVDGYDEVRGGCVESHHIDPTMVRISLSARQGVVDSPFLWYHQEIARCILEDAYPDMTIKGRQGNPELADRYRRDLEAAPSNTVAGDMINDRGDANTDPRGGEQLEECPFDLFWIDPVMYRRKKFSKPQRLLGGREIPANVNLEEKFPDGMCIAMNADQVLDVYPENKNKKWLFCVYGIREHALHGAGTTNLLGPQDTRNDLKAYLIANVYYNAGRREFLRNGAVTGNRLPALNESAIVNDVPEDKPIAGWAYETIAGSPLPAQAVELYQSEAGALQEGAGTSSLSNEGAAADIKALGTATGVAAMRDMAVGRMGPNLMLLTEMDVEHSFLILEHELENFSEERFMKMANQAVTPEDTDGSITFSAEGIKAFMECDPRVDLEVTAEAGSWMPRTEAERHARFAAFIEIATAVAEKMQGDPRAEELIALAADIYGVEMDLGGWTSTEQVAAARIRAYADIVAVYEKRKVSQPTPELVQEIIMSTPDAMIDAEMDNHALYLGFYKAWWASDEGKSCSPLLRAIIKAVHILHRQGLVHQAQERSKDELESDRPKQEAAAKMAAEAAAMGGGKENKEPSVTLPYKEAPEDIKRQIEADAGYTPSQMGAASDQGDTEMAKEQIKIEGTLVTQQQKADLELRNEQVKAQLDVQKEGAKGQIAEQRAEGDHARNMEALEVEQQHETGMQSAEMAHDSAEKGSDRVHKERLSDKEAEVKKQTAKKK